MERVGLRFRRLFDPEQGARGYLVARWLFLRALGGIYFSAFFALLFQVKGLIGTQGILPAAGMLKEVQGPAWLRLWEVPTLLWVDSSNRMLMAVCWVGLLAAVLVVANVWPRGTLGACFVCFLSFVSAAQDFSGYQSDGMLLEAGFLALFVAPGGWLPGWGSKSRGVWAAYLLLLWEWFRIYFQSGVVKLASGDPTWRNLTAMYEYYQNGPLPTWIGWYLQHLPHWFHIATAALTLGMELVLVWLAFFGRRARVVCFWVVTVWQVGVIATANYAFLNYLVLVLAMLLLDDRSLLRWVPARWRGGLGQMEEEPDAAAVRPPVRLGVAAFVLTWVGYATMVPMVKMLWTEAPLPIAPVAALESFRIANSYGLFAVMTPHRFEIEFQGSNDGVNWVAYPFKYKPQDVRERPRIYAPYQPRFDWNLWFASLGEWQQNLMVPRTEELLLDGDEDVLGLFRGNPFRSAPPKFVRAVLWQYWFSSREEKREQGVWWRREMVGPYAPTLTKAGGGRFAVVQ